MDCSDPSNFDRGVNYIHCWNYFAKTVKELQILENMFLRTDLAFPHRLSLSVDRRLYKNKSTHVSWCESKNTLSKYYISHPIMLKWAQNLN